MNDCVNWNAEKSECDATGVTECERCMCYEVKPEEE